MAKHILNRSTNRKLNATSATTPIPAKEGLQIRIKEKITPQNPSMQGFPSLQEKFSLPL